MSDDIVARLRNKRAWDLGNLDEMDEAADEIERLRAELAALRVGLYTKHQQYVEANEARIDANNALGNPSHWLFRIVGPKSGATVQGESDAPREAADEIERLRADLDAYQKERDEEVVRLRADCVKLETAHGQNMREIDRLRAELAAETKARKAYADEWPRLVAERDALRDLLREAYEWRDTLWSVSTTVRINAALKGNTE